MERRVLTVVLEDQTQQGCLWILEAVQFFDEHLQLTDSSPLEAANNGKESDKCKLKSQTGDPPPTA
jgi:hypothetical protein